jgi:nicotinate-nucleotide--dimethylbenzimidazole phosphoribosyltransferase
MNQLEQTLAKIKPLDKNVVHRVQAELETQMSNTAGLGHLRSILLNYAGIIGEKPCITPKKCTIIACGDHGVAAMKVSAYPPETTVHMTKNYLVSKGATANALSNFAGSDMFVVDMGIGAPTGDIPGLIDRKVAFGTKNCAEGPAMTRDEALASLYAGIELAEKYSAQGYCCFLPGEMGIANTTASAAIVACLCNLTPAQATGRGTNISDERLKLKISVVEQVLQVNQPDPSDGIDILQKIGGFELGCIAGIILGAAANRSFVVLDGFNTGAAALIASTICPEVREYLMGSHLAAEPAHDAILKKLGLHPYMDMQFRLGEATGSSIIVNLLDAAIASYSALTDGTIPQIPAIKPASLEYAPPSPAIPALDEASMEKCQLRIDNLCKPIYSLGRLENIAVKLAGITGNSQPQNLKKAILCICSKDGLSSTQQKLTAAFAAHAQADPLQTSIHGGSLKEAFIYGQSIAKELSTKGYKIIGIGSAEISPEDVCGKKAAIQCNLLKTENGELRYKLEEFLSLPAAPELEQIAALSGFLLAAPKHHLLVVLDNESSELAAALAESFAPAIRNYVLHTQPDSLSLDMTTGGGCLAALGLKLVDASLHMLNDMKTFAEAKVAVATDGPGAGRQTHQ